MPRVEQRGRELWVLIPEDISKALSINDGDAISFEMLDNELAGMRKAHALTNEEITVLRKINEVRFAERTKERLRNMLSDSEQKVLGRLVKLGVVQFYKNGKYKDSGVYSITRDYYSLVTLSNNTALAQSQRLEPRSDALHSVFGDQKYLTVDSMEHAQKLLSLLEKEVCDGEVVSVRGFDKKIYITTREVVDAVGNKIFSALKGREMHVTEIAQYTSEPEGLIKTVIEVLRETGDVIEKKRGVYALA